MLTNTHLINAEFLLEYFGRMTPANCLDCLRDLLKFSLVGHAATETSGVRAEQCAHSVRIRLLTNFASSICFSLCLLR